MGGWGGGGWGSGGWGNSLGGISRGIDYYISLITSQYQNSPNFLTWVADNLQYLDDATQAIESFGYVFNLDTAAGAQLDILGAIIGANRLVGFQPSNGVSPLLDDETFRLLIKATIGRNQWDGGISTLQSLWKELFPGGFITVLDGQNMTITVFCAGAFTSIIKDLITNDYIIPRPQGVLVNYTFAQEPILGFDVSNTFIAGFDLGHFA